MEYNNEYIAKEILLRLGYTNLKPGNQVTIKCPNPAHNDKRPSCSVSLDKLVGHCFSCGYSFNLKNLYYERFHNSIFKDLGLSRNLDFKKIEVYTPNFDDTPETDFYISSKLMYEPDITEASREWIKKRGLNVKTLNMLGVKFLKSAKVVKKSDPENKSDWMFFYNKIFIPIYENNKLISFEARDILGEKRWKEKLVQKGENPEEHYYKKVLYPKYSSVSTLYKLNELNKNKKLYVVEGLMDCISLRTIKELQNSTTTFGVGIKERQFYLLSQFKEICIIPNNDLPGLSILQKLKERPDLKNVSVIFLPKTVKDVNDILQQKDSRLSCIEDLINKKWFYEKESPLYDIDVSEKIRSLLSQ